MNILLIEINPFASATTPISLGYIAAYLKSNGFGVKILAVGEDMSLSCSGFHELINSFKPALVGLTAYQRTMLYVKGFAGLIKSIDNNIKIIIGGPQATFMPSSSFAVLADIDYICRSSGEVTLLRIARAVDSGTPFSDLLGVSYKDSDGAVYDTPEIEAFTDLDQYSSPYLNDVFDYSCMREAIMLTSRGCPHHCIYCYTPQAFKHKITFHSVDRVIEEIKWISKKGVKRLWFADPNISFKPERLIELLDRILSENLKFEMWMQTRADLVTKELMKKMKQAGVKTIAFGLESASEQVLTKLGKHLAVEKVAQAIRMAQQQKIDVELFTIFGLPYESFDDAVKTLEFVKKNNVKIMGNTNSQQMQIYFGTHLAGHYKDYNIRPLNTDRPAYISIGSQYETEYIRTSELHEIQNMWRAHSLDGGKRIVS
ncbi:MAG: B12-binding domain-containing radical SAM protein [Desulfobacterales bacterium]|uniref:B12-binding domain-containing radical SAM protein n=1 Tax=Candidatus Desulfaltia bathyphila TaxID=2841697 RepID=A0A8J6TBM7_9BACT|nr:B12-binding domain-containing radical SAM protein [Candidatus Desulfaltia bathyphila]MBL7196153.1 B12-binding domain-containing radical SAM protein [Desulfobacterales bacterium]MBL7208221.1 B12-binding domain-containing radical SAM protein [Desulfobacterales bacterium]